MKFKHKPTVVNGVQFKLGMEDGWLEVGHQSGDPYFYPETISKAPYIRTYDSITHFKNFNTKQIIVKEGDWILTERGKKYVMSDREVKKYFDIIDDEVDSKLLTLFDEQQEVNNE
jgi:hypothetical protein